MKRILILLLFFYYGIHAQEFTPDYVEHHAGFTPVTPNAASFLQYGNTPVNHATGVPQISIPLFTIQEDGVSIPISLSYHASGVRVDDLASVVGLKWTLNAGGGVFRQVNDKPDESGWLLPAARDFITVGWSATNFLDDEQVQRGMDNSNANYDYYPDDFSYSFSGNSGSFIFDRNGKMQHELKDVLHIEKIATGFMAKDGMGSNYYFGDAIEYNAKAVLVAADLNLNFDRSNATTGWMLDRIVTKNNKQINFTYQPYTFQYQLKNISHSISHTEKCKTKTVVQPFGNDHVFAWGPCGCEGLTTFLTAPVYNITESTTTIVNTPTNQLVETIETTNLKATFNYEEDPSLSTWKKKLVSITVLDKIKNKSKSFTFTYDTFGGDPRLRLKSVQETGFDGSAKPPYQFDYISGELPAKGSLSKDYHGFYNGKNNQTLIPFSIDAYSKFPPSYRRRLADRRESPQHLKRGTLNKIVYPTGGSATFEYESNAVPDTLGLNPVIVNKRQLLTPYLYEETAVAGSYTSFRTTFTVEKDLIKTKGTPVHYSNFSEICDFNPDEPSIDCSRFNIYPVNADGSLGTALFTPFKVIGAEGSVHLFKGNYVFELLVETQKLNANPGKRIEVILKWLSEEEQSELGTRYTGGLRVQSITDKDENGTIAKQTKYTYDQLVGYSLAINDMQKNYGIKTVYSSNNIGLDQRFQKSGYYYKEVNVETIGDQTPIRTKEKFEANIQNKSYQPIMIRQEVYDQNDMVKSVDMEYLDIVEKKTQFYILADKTRCIDKVGGTAGDGKLPWFLGYSFPESMVYFHKKSLLTKRTEIDYYRKPGIPLRTSIIQYKYLYNDDMQMIKQEMDGRLYAENERDLMDQNFSIRPDGKHTEIAYTYPKDHQAENTTIATLQNNYQVALPISKTVRANGRLIQGQFMDYDASGNVVGTYRHNKGKATNSATSGHIPSDYEKHQEFALVTGRPVEVQPQNGIPTAILWDSSYTYVLAQLVGVTKDELDAVTPAVDLSTTTDAALKTLYTSLRSSFPEAQVSTFVHEPLQGVVAVTDARGYTTQYDYDGLSRLIQIKDADGHLISENKYHYKNQN